MSSASKPCCSVGARDDVAVIDAALRSGTGIKAVSKSTGAAVTSLRRHARGCVGIQGPGSTDPDPSTEIHEVHPVALAAGTKTNAGSRSDDAREEREQINGATYQQRVLEIASLIARGKYLGRRTAQRLAEQWGVSRGAVGNYARAAAVVCAADRGELATVRETSIGAWQRLRDAAVKAEDFRAAVQAQAGLDRASGVVQPTGAKVEICIGSNPAVLGFMARIADGLDPKRFPAELRDGVAAARARVLAICEAIDVPIDVQVVDDRLLTN